MKTIAPVSTPVRIGLTDGQPTTTSNDVAAHFAKRHDTVLRAIRQLDCSPEFHARNFAGMDIEVQIGLGKTRKSQAFRMTRDGFTFLCMGFTGKEAAKWKEAYIQAFNEMEGWAQALAAPPTKWQIEHNVRTLLHHIDWLTANWHTELEPALRMLRSPIAADYRDHVVAVASLGSSIAGSLLGAVPARAQR